MTLVVLLCEMRLPTDRAPWLDAFPVQLVDFLQRQALCLRNEQPTSQSAHESKEERKAVGCSPDVDKAEDQHAEEDEQDQRANVLSDTRGEEGQQEVPNPVYYSSGQLGTTSPQLCTYWWQSLAR